MLVQAYALAAPYYCPERKPIPRLKWSLGRHLVDAGLAIEDENGVLVDGCEEQFQLYFSRRLAGSQGGKARKRGKHSQAMQSIAKHSQALLGDSEQVLPETLDRILAGYPKRLGGLNKAKALKTLAKFSKTELERFDRAVGNYARYCIAAGHTGPNAKFVMQLPTFVNGQWLDYVDSANLGAGSAGKLKSVEDAMAEILAAKESEGVAS